MTNEKTLKAMGILNKYKDKMLPPLYDFLIDSPHETDEDKIESLRFIAKIPKPYKVQLFSMVLFPGTQLYEMAKRENLIEDENTAIYNKHFMSHKTGYLNLVFKIVQKGILPGWLLNCLVSAPVVLVLNSKVMRTVIVAVEKLMKVLPGRCYGTY